MAQITVVVPARNAQATIGRTLAALGRQAGGVDYEVIVVDSGSVDGTAGLVEASGVARLQSNPNGEPAGSRNLGASVGDGSVLAFTDADCEPDPGWLAAGARAIATADIVQGRVLPATDPGPFDRTVAVVREHGLYETANLFVRREVFDRVGGFQPLLELAPDEPPFGEDAWFVWRARRAGARTAFSPDAVVLHAVFARDAHDYIAEHGRRRFFPPLVAAVPELRRAFLHHGIFLSRDSESFDIALAGLIAAGLMRRPIPALVGALPYLMRVARASRAVPAAQRLPVAGARLLADVVTCSALVSGSTRARTVVI